MSRKQTIYISILYFSILQIRNYAETEPYWRHHRQNQRLRKINALSYLIHQIPESLAEASYTENDRGFLDFAIPDCLEIMAKELFFPILQGFVNFYDEAPEEWKQDLRWVPSSELRKKLRDMQTEPR